MSTNTVKRLPSCNLTDAVNELTSSASEPSFDVSTFFEKFELLLQVPDAINKLRRFIMKTAVQGTLVPQLPSEGTAESVLEQIRQLKLELKESNKLRGDTCVRPLSADVVLSVIPFSWRWVSFGDLLINRDGERIPVSREQREAKEKVYDYYGASGVIDKIDNFLFDKPLLLIGEDGANLINRSTPIAFIARGKYWVNNHAHVLDGISEDLLRYIELFINSISLIPYITGSAQPKMNQAKMNTIPIPLPPLAEQKRIVSKVNELMGLCDRLETLEAERKERHAVLSRAALARFAETPSPSNLQFLFHKSFDVEPRELRQAILSLAVRGGLVNQLSKDEPSRILLKKLDEVRTGLAEKQSVGIPRKVPSLQQESFPFELPTSWEWRRIGHVALSIDYGTSQKAGSNTTQVPVFRMGNIQDGKVVDDNLKYVPPTIDDLPHTYLKRGDILFNRTNSLELVGKSGLFCGVDDTATFASYLIRIRLPSEYLFPPFVNLALNAQYFRKTQIEPNIVQQCGQANFNGSKLAATLIPIPPLAEQKRIVAKVDELLALVDELERQLVESRGKGQQLMEAIVAKLTAASGCSS